jgi:fatty acid desaturase
MSDRVESGQGDVSTVGASEKVRDIVGRKRLRKMMARRDGPGLTYLAGHLGLTVVTGVLLGLFLGTLWVIPACVLHGFVIVHFFAPFHECSHSTTFKTRWMNTALGWFTGLVLMLPPLVFKYQHADHHTYTQNLRRDPQMIPMGERLGGYLYYASSIPYFLDIIRVLFSHPFGHFSEIDRRSVPESARPAVQREAWIFWAVYGVLALVSVAMGSWAVVTYWLIPRIVGEPLMRIIRMSEHVGCSREPDMLLNSRTVKGLAPLRWLAWNMPYHTAHHAVPLVPFHALPELTETLLDHIHDVRIGYIATVRFQIRNALNNAAAP